MTEADAISYAQAKHIKKGETLVRAIYDSLNKQTCGNCKFNKGGFCCNAYSCAEGNQVDANFGCNRIKLIGWTK